MLTKKKRTLKGKKKKIVTCKETPNKLSEDFLAKSFIPGDSELHCQSSKRKEKNANQE